MSSANCLYFNPRPREEGDCCRYRCFRVCHISIHALVKRATRSTAWFTFSLIISIHALVKRATDFKMRCMLITGISIHALVKRATNGLVNIFYPFKYFNPRPREEGDILKERQYRIEYISIHALVKRATHE